MSMSDTGRDPGALGLPDDEPHGSGRSGDDWGDDRADETRPDDASPDEDGKDERATPGPEDEPDGGGRGGDIGGRLA